MIQRMEITSGSAVLGAESHGAGVPDRPVAARRRHRPAQLGRRHRCAASSSLPHLRRTRLWPDGVPEGRRMVERRGCGRGARRVRRAGGGRGRVFRRRSHGARPGVDATSPGAGPRPDRTGDQRCARAGAGTGGGHARQATRGALGAGRPRRGQPDRRPNLAGRPLGSRRQSHGCGPRALPRDEPGAARRRAAGGGAPRRRCPGIGWPRSRYRPCSCSANSISATSPTTADTPRRRSWARGW